MWFRALLIRWLKIPVVIHSHTASVERVDFVESYTPEHYKTWAAIYKLIPGLYTVHYNAMREVMENLEKLAATDANAGERIRLTQRAVDCWKNLEFANNSAKSLEAFFAAKREQTQEQSNLPNGGSNLI